MRDLNDGKLYIGLIGFVLVIAMITMLTTKKPETQVEGSAPAGTTATAPADPLVSAKGLAQSWVTAYYSTSVSPEEWAEVLTPITEPSYHSYLKGAAAGTTSINENDVYLRRAVENLKNKREASVTVKSVTSEKADSRYVVRMEATETLGGKSHAVLITVYVIAKNGYLVVNSMTMVVTEDMY
jgi:hypothetical protein